MRILLLILALGVSALEPVSEPPRTVVPVPADGLAIHFRTDPTADGAAVMAGKPLDRLDWNRGDRPAYDGDRRGSLTARYDAKMPAGLSGYSLPRTVTQDDAFTAAATFTIHSDGFFADPLGFFQISWGLWNAAGTGLDRTGSPEDFACDSFDLIGFDYFPNVSPFFGGPFLSPSVIGEAVPDDPGFGFLGCFANSAFAFGPAIELPIDRPLLAVMEHRPDERTIVATVYRIGERRRLEPVADAVVPLDQLVRPRFTVDTIGLTLWNDGNSGALASLEANVTFQSLVFVHGLLDDPEALFHVAPARR